MPTVDGYFSFQSSVYIIVLFVSYLCFVQLIKTKIPEQCYVLHDCLIIIIIIIIIIIHRQIRLCFYMYTVGCGP